MQLIDKLEERSDAVKLYESVDKVQAQCDSYRNWWLHLDGVAFPITDDAFDTLLNLLRIPIKYIKRCTDEDGSTLAERSVNYWLEKCGDLSFLVSQVDGVAEYAVTQVFPGKRLYLPSVKVNDLIIEYLGGDVQVQSFIIEDDIFNAVYLTQETIDDMRLGVRVLFSDCFTITPRFDGVLCSDDGALLCWPTLGRKFRVANNTIPQVVDQIQEFLDLSLDGLRETIVPALRNFEDNSLVNGESFVIRLCNDLRLSRKVKDELTENCVPYPDYDVVEVIHSIAGYTAKVSGDTTISVSTARDIQVALSNYIVKGSFK